MRVRLLSKVTGGDLQLRLLRTIGSVLAFVGGFFLLTLLTAGTANAEEPDGGLIGGLVRPVAEGVGQVTEPLAPLVHEVVDAAEPVTDVVRPVVAPVTKALAPVVSTVSGLVEPVARPLIEATAPVVRPITKSRERVVAPVNEHSAPVVTTKTVTTKAVTETVPTNAVPIKTGTIKTGTTGTGTTKVEPSVEVAFPTWGTVPVEPTLPPFDPAVPGSSGGTVTVQHGPTIDGVTTGHGAGLTAPNGSWRAPPGVLLGSSWWEHHDNDHPS